MKKNAAVTNDLAPLITELRTLIHSARRSAATAVDTLQVMTNFEIGRRIVEHEQKGEKRAEYGKELLKDLSVRLVEEFGSGFSPVNLSQMRKFFLTWKDRVSCPIFQTVSEKLDDGETLQTQSDKFAITQTDRYYFENKQKNHYYNTKPHDIYPAENTFIDYYRAHNLLDGESVYTHFYIREHQTTVIINSFKELHYVPED